ncbi:MAG: hypothetical protein DHS20C16_10380 [Phycisphaerae bacterium]|nr:MAG: hypothetical protein DHS20C16_10380 [Phycisphaerae bacterium]
MKRILAVGLLLALTAPASATLVLNETFDYADNASLNAVWNASGSNPDYALDTGFGNGQPSYGMPSPTGNFQGRLARNLPGGPIQATDLEPARIKFDFYLDDAGAANSWVGARHYVELRGYENGAYADGGLQNLLAIGVTNSVTAPEAHNNSFYQGRVTFGSNWNTLDEGAAPNRAAGWHEMAIVITGTEVRYLVDGILSEVEARPNNFLFDSVVLGSDLTANGHAAWVDNLMVETNVPEPATLALLAMGGVAVLRRRR